MENSGISWLLPVRNAICTLYLLVFTLFEGYSAAATALDHSGRFPAWESKLGTFLFILPCELLVSLALLLYGERARLGFYLVVGNLFVYVAFMCLESILVHDAPSTTGAMWEILGIWAFLFASAMGSAHLLATRPRSS
jgi:hypothetical protein